VTSHHRILVIRLVEGTDTDLKRIGARRQIEYPFAELAAPRADSITEIS
jgi:hypothetical protein